MKYNFNDFLSKGNRFGYFILICGLVLISVSTLWFYCNGSPDPQPPKPDPVINWIETETETGKMITVLKDSVPILRIEAINGADGKDGIGIDGKDGLDGQDWVLPDTLYLKDLGNGISKWYAISNLPLPPTKPTPDTAYVADVVLEGDTWVYILRGDSLKLHWTYSYKDINGQLLDTAEVYFHVAYQMNGQTYSLKPNPNTTQELSLIMYGLPQGDIVPCVAAFVIKEEHRIYSLWVKSTDYEWFVRKE